jgi:excisionase family DNA binding protein
MTLDEIRCRLFVTVAEVAEILDMDERTVRRAIEQGQIPAIKVGVQTAIPAPKLLALIEPADTPGPAAPSAELAVLDAVTAAREILAGALRALDALTGYQSQDHGRPIEALAAGQDAAAGGLGVPPRLLRGGDGAA